VRDGQGGDTHGTADGGDTAEQGAAGQTAAVRGGRSGPSAGETGYVGEVEVQRALIPAIHALRAMLHALRAMLLYFSKIW
jgi:hypothetical protein